jgi:hypothetical protein
MDEYLTQIVEQELLLASATTETGIGGDVRSSSCAIERDGERFRLEKDAPVISYGASADAVLVTARRTPDSPPNDQVLVVVPITPSTSLSDPAGTRSDFAARAATVSSCARKVTSTRYSPTLRRDLVEHDVADFSRRVGVGMAGYRRQRRRQRAMSLFATRRAASPVRLRPPQYGSPS